jgi:hypothetical protein
MPRHIWSVLCLKGVLDQYTNTVSLLEAIEGMKITPETPLPDRRINIRTPMHLVSLWCRGDRDTPESFEARSVIVLPSGLEVPGVPMHAGLQESRRIRTFMRMQSMPFEGGGQYGFAVEYRSAPTEPWTRVATIPVDVEVAPRAADVKPEEPITVVPPPPTASPIKSRPVRTERHRKRTRKPAS